MDGAEWMILRGFARRPGDELEHKREYSPEGPFQVGDNLTDTAGLVVLDYLYLGGGLFCLLCALWVIILF